ncbi:MAG: AlpA family phage regulatory protein [Deltaproteobacteria bacterium]|nr:AlpA family phage regulatory protein [Deltaproteobacteria bacterium]
MPSESNAVEPLPETGFARLPQVLKVFPVSKATWWAGVRTGRYPKSVKLGPMMTAWRVEDIRALLANPDRCDWGK